jgi:hypothetical protein
MTSQLQLELAKARFIDERQTFSSICMLLKIKQMFYKKLAENRFMCK